MKYTLPDAEMVNCGSSPQNCAQEDFLKNAKDHNSLLNSGGGRRNRRKNMKGGKGNVLGLMESVSTDPVMNKEIAKLAQLSIQTQEDSRYDLTPSKAETITHISTNGGGSRKKRKYSKKNTNKNKRSIRRSTTRRRKIKKSRKKNKK